MVEFPISRVVYRGGNYASSVGGVSCANAGYDASNSYTYIGSRLANNQSIYIGVQHLGCILTVVPRRASHSNSSHRLESYSNLHTTHFYQTKKSFKRGIGHARNIEEAEMFLEVNQHISKLQPIRISPLGEGKDLNDPKDIANLQKKRDRGITAYHIYELELRGDIWVIKTEIYKNRSEAIYALYKKE